MPNVVDAIGFVLGVIWANFMGGVLVYTIMGSFVKHVDRKAVDGMAGKSRRVLVIRAVAEAEIVHEMLMLVINLLLCIALVWRPSVGSLVVTGVLVLPRVWLLGNAILRRIKLDRLPVGARFFPTVSLETPADAQPVPAPSEQQSAAFKALKRRGYRRLGFFGLGVLVVAAGVFFLLVGMLHR